MVFLPPAITCDEGVLDAEPEAFQLFVTGELDPHETPCGRNQAWVLAAAEAVNKRREPKGTVADLDVIEAALKGGLDVVILVKRQLNPLPGEGLVDVEHRERKQSFKAMKRTNSCSGSKRNNLEGFQTASRLKSELIWVSRSSELSDEPVKNKLTQADSNFSQGCRLKVLHSWHCL